MDFQIKNLEQNQNLKKEYCRHIEKSFNYPSDFSYEIDFAPSFAKNNLKNCYYLYSKDKIVSTCITLKKILSLGKSKFAIELLGGIATAPQFRGKGITKKLINEIVKKSTQKTQILWTNQFSFFEKLGFQMSKNIFLVEGDQSQRNLFAEKKVKLLTYDEWSQIKSLYSFEQKKYDAYIERSEYDWEVIKKIHSSRLFIKKENGIIVEYFFLGKGFDMKGVIIESSSKTPPPYPHLSPVSSLKSIPMPNFYFKTSNERLKKLFCQNNILITGLDSI